MRSRFKLQIYTKNLNCSPLDEKKLSSFPTSHAHIPRLARETGLTKGASLARNVILTSDTRLT